MQTTFGVNAVALVDNVPRTLPLRSVIHNYVQHQREVIVRRSKYHLRTLEARKHILEGQLIALDHLDEVIALIRGAQDRDTARTGLIERFGLTYIQAQAILELRLQQLTALESDAIRREHADIVEQIAELRDAARRRGQGPRPHQGGAASRSATATATSGARRSPPPRTTSTSRT